MKQNARESEQKRLESLRKRKQEYQLQKNALKSAFSNLDAKHKKIIFNDDDTIQRIETNGQKDSSKFVLFDGDDEDDDGTYNFEVKEHFEGEKGKKLWELQNKTKKDKRFEMDARFLDETNEDQDGADGGTIESHGEETEEISIQKEKELERKIMEKVLGKPVVEKPNIVKKQAPKYLRYDPSNPDHRVYELKETEKKPKKEKKKKVEVVEEQLPEVSKDQFYQVTTDFKQSLQEKQSFSLLNMFGQTEIAEDESNNVKRKRTDIEDDKPEELKKSKLENGTNPFKYDSSDDENEKSNDSSKKEDAPIIFPKKTNARPWHEPFFFAKDDYRFQEGRDFLQKAKSRSQEEFLQLRSELKKIIKAKVKNITKKHKMFKKKLGGSKRKVVRKKKPQNKQ